MSQVTRYPEIEVSGEPREMGQQIGEAARSQIRTFAQIVLERANLSMCVSRENAMALANASVPYVAEYAPHMLEELRGMAEGSGVNELDLMMLQIRNQFKDNVDAGCTSFAVAPTATTDGCAVIGQNWDNDPALDAFTIVLTRRPAGKPALMNITQAGLIAYIGLSDAGIGICMNAVPAPSRPVGLPHYFLIRALYETRSLDEAVAAVRRGHRALAGNVMMTTPQGPADLEITIDDVRVLRDHGGGVLTHTNHCVHRGLESTNDGFPELIQSHARKRRIDQLFGLVDRPISIATMQDILRDREGFPRSICRWPNDDEGTGFWKTVFSVIIEVEAGLMYIARGNPCDVSYERYHL